MRGPTRSGRLGFDVTPRRPHGKPPRRVEPHAAGGSAGKFGGRGGLPARGLGCGISLLASRGKAGLESTVPAIRPAGRRADEATSRSACDSKCERSGERIVPGSGEGSPRVREKPPECDCSDCACGTGEGKSPESGSPGFLRKQHGFRGLYCQRIRPFRAGRRHPTCAIAGDAPPNRDGSAASPANEARMTRWLTI